MDQKQFEYAVSIAASPEAAERQQANDFLRDVLANSEQHWPLCITVFLQGAGAPSATEPGQDGHLKCSPQARFFALQVVDSVMGDKLKFDLISPDSRLAIQQAFLDYVQKEYVNGQAEAGQSQSLLRNRLAHTLALLFISLYPSIQMPPLPSTSQSLLQTLLPLLKPSVNPHTTLLVLHTLVEINEEVHDTLLKSARPFTQDRMARDGKLRDAVRENEAGLMHDVVTSVWEEALGRIEGGEGQGWAEVVEWAVRAYSGYVPWLEITLTVTPHSLYLLNRLLEHPHIPFRLLSLDSLSKIVAKGMKDPAEKIQLFSVLSIVAGLTPLEEKTRDAQSDPNVQEFRERAAKLLNSFGIELGKIVVPEALAEDKTKAEAEVMLENCLPLFLRFLGDNSNDTSQAVFGMLDDLLKRNKKAKKTDILVLSESKHAFFTSLLEVIIKKMEWDRDADWSLGEDDGDADPDDVLIFQTLRKQLKTAVEAIANVDPDLFIGTVSQLISSTMQRFQAQGPQGVTWQNAEMALFLLYSWSEFSATKVQGRAAFFQIPPELQTALSSNKQLRKASFSEQASSDQPPSANANGSSTVPKANVDYAALPLTIQGELLILAVQSGITSYPHPSVALQFFECASRYVDFFRARTDCVQPTLGTFLDTRGIHNESAAVRHRAFYLFHRFIKDIKPALSVDFVPSILESMSDLLTIKPTMPERETPEEDLLVKAQEVPDDAFDAQLYLFETVGILISVLQEAPEQQLGFLQAACNPLLARISTDVQTPMSGPDDVLPILNVHHLVMALGNIAKGFPEPSEKALATAPPAWISVFKQATEAILAVLERMNQYKIIRDAARFAFARIVATTSTRVLEYVAMFVKGIVQHFEPSELVEFLAFLGLILHRLKDNLFDVLDGLVLPIIQKIFQSLAVPANGTDDELQQASLKSAYLGFISSIMSAKLDSVFLSETNKPQLEDILNNVLGFASSSNDPVCQRLAFGILAKAITAWATNPSVAGTIPVAASNGPGGIPPLVPSTQVIPGFEVYVYDRLVPLAFEVPTNPTFKIKDGQAQLVMSEITNLFRATILARGQEAVSRLTDVYFPSINCPQETAVEFITQLTTQDPKGFRRWFSEFIKSAKESQIAAAKAAAEEAERQS